jgi:DNA-binding transcriptional LysR family regulator
VNLHQLRLFCAVVERGSFSLASRELFVSQPALSIQIKRLERSLGLRLLRRSRGGAVPTPAGQELYTIARAILEQVETAERRLRALRTGEAGTLAIGVSHTGALYFLTDAVKAFAQVHPAVRVNIEVATAPTLFDKLQRGSLDAGLEWGPVIPASLEAVELWIERFGIIASPQHECTHVGRITQEQFLRSSFITLQYGLGALSFIEMWLLEHNLLPASITRLPSIDAVKRLVEANLGLTILSHLSVERELEAGHLTWLEMEGFRMERPIVLLTRKQDPSQLLAQFVAFTREFARTRMTRPPGR